MGVRVGICLYDSVTDLPLPAFPIFHSDIDAESFLEWWNANGEMDLTDSDLRLVRNEQAAVDLLKRWENERD